MNNQQFIDRTAICVAGWHYNRRFYNQLLSIAPNNVWVISHQTPKGTPTWLISDLRSDHIFFKPNIGYDWGCYQQFIHMGIWKEHDYVFFLHDDLTIKDSGFIDHSIALLEDGFGIVGNGRVASKRNWPNSHVASYAHSNWKPPTRDFKHDVVRGSFFATKQSTLDLIGQLEVYWDAFQLTSDFGNWSTRASCGRIEYLHGTNAFAFLSQEYLESDYLIEHVRGTRNGTISESKSKLINGLYVLIRRLSNYHMSIYWQERCTGFRPFALFLTSNALNLFSTEGLSVRRRLSQL